MKLVEQPVIREKLAQMFASSLLVPRRRRRTPLGARCLPVLLRCAYVLYSVSLVQNLCSLLLQVVCSCLFLQTRVACLAERGCHCDRNMLAT